MPAEPLEKPQCCIDTVPTGVEFSMEPCAYVMILNKIAARGVSASATTASMAATDQGVVGAHRELGDDMPVVHRARAPRIPGVDLMLTLPPRSTEVPVLCYDRSPSRDQERWNFRSTSDLSALPPGVNRHGLSALRLSGSASLSSEHHMAQILAAANAPLTVVDLREESHATVGGYPVTWVAPNNWANVGLSRDQMLSNEQQHISALKAGGPVVLTRHWDLKTGVVPPRTITANFSPVHSEQELVEKAQARYERLQVTDHLRPTDSMVDHFIKVVRSLAEGSAMHVHCKGGKGRTTTFMVLYDMLRNAGQVNANHIIERQKGLASGYDLTAEGLHPERRGYRDERKQFVIAFHAYARQNPGGQPMMWSQWLAQGRTQD